MANTSNSKSKTSKAKTIVGKAPTKRGKATEQGIVNVVKNETCPTKAANPAEVTNTTSAYTKLAKNANRFDMN